jgi:cobalamin biosynthetic protein CobC
MGGEGIWHGGDLDEARALFPGAPEPWVDLSTGINPVPYPLPALPSRLFERLPAPADHAALEQAAAAAYGVADPATVVAAPGTQILISILPRLAPPGPVAVLGPTYAEHARAWSLAGHEVREVRSPTEARGAAVLVVVNPNNPDGRALPRDALLDLAGFMDRRGGRLVVDEAFADFDDAQALAPVRPRGAVVLRSFGKTYGLAGIRLGFAVADIGVAASLRGALGPWAASGPAIEIGRLALRDRTWLARAAEERGGDARRLDGLLARFGATAGTTLYRLVETERAPALHAHLGRAGIWTRRFQHDSSRLRFGLPGAAEAWERLERALAEFG